MKCVLPVLHTNTFMEAWIEVWWGKMESLRYR